MEFPLWAVFALICASMSALMLIIPERAQVDGFAMAFWNKVAAFIFMVPLVLWNGLPQQWEFYALVATQALLWVVSDVIFFRAIPKVGAGVVSRILPISVILTFCLWFLFDHELFRQYLGMPMRSLLVCAALCGSVYFAMRLKKCEVSWAAVRMIWFVLFAATVGPLMYKIITRYTDIQQGPFAFVLFEAAIMIPIWCAYYTWRRPVPINVMFSGRVLKYGALIGGVSSLVAISKFAAMHYVDNPGLVPAVKYTDAIMIMGYYKMTGRTEKADVIAGLGIVGCAAAIILLKSF